MKLTKMFPIVAMALTVVFIAGCNKKDDPGIRPTVVSTDPISNGIDKAVNGSVSATFNVAMDPASISNATFTLKANGSSVEGTTTYAGTTASFSPAADFLPSTVYIATITNGAKDTSGKSLAKDYTWTFTTSAKSDLISPTVTVADPANSAVGVTLTKQVKITFSEAMDASSITSFTFAVRQGATSITGAVTYAASIATFTPASNLLPNTVYSVTVTTGVKDMASNALAVNFTSSFTTGAAPDTTAPTVTSTDPLNNATGVATNKLIKVIFSEAMTASTINSTTFTVVKGATAVAGAVTYSGTTATFTPSALLALNSIYTATVTTGAKDLAGNALAADKVVNFTTASASNLAVVELGAAGNYVILAKTAITNIPTSAITGDVGLSPAAESYITGFTLTAATGFSTATEVVGKVYAADQASPTPINLTTAVENMITAYNDAAGRPSPDFLELGTGNIGGQTLASGLYKWTNTVTLPSDVTISGGANDVWIFQIAGDLTMSNGVNISLIGGAQAKNIFWQVAGTVTLGTTSHFEGIVLSMTGITLQTGASMTGRALAQSAVILDANAVTEPQ